MEKEMKEECGNCRFGSSHTDEDDEFVIMCLRFPPVIDVVWAVSSHKEFSNAESSAIYWASPVCYESHWCGEYIRREVSE